MKILGTHALPLTLACLGLATLVTAGEIVRPRIGSYVSEVDQVIIRPTSGTSSVVLVRPKVKNAPWKVQAPIQSAPRGYARAQVKYPLGKTTNYEVVVLTFNGNDKVPAWKAGDTVATFPEEAIASRTVPVTIRTLTFTYDAPVDEDARPTLRE